MVRPLSRMDIFYSGSVTNLKEYQSQKSLTDYRNSVVSLTRFEKEHSGPVRNYQDVETASESCPCLPAAFKDALASMLDVSLLKDPAFMLIGISNLFGMAALYIPFFYLVDAAFKNVSSRSAHSKATHSNFLSSRESRKETHHFCCQLLESPTHSLVSSAAMLLISRPSMLCS